MLYRGRSVVLDQSGSIGWCAILDVGQDRSGAGLVKLGMLGDREG